MAPHLNKYTYSVIHAISTNIPLITSLAALLGFIKSILFYQCFDINILEYLTFTDFVISIAEESLFVFFLLPLVLLGLILTDSNPPSPTKKVIISENTNETPKSNFDFFETIELYHLRLYSPNVKLAVLGLIFLNIIAYFLIDKYTKVFSQELVFYVFQIAISIIIFLYIIEGEFISRLSSILLAIIIYVLFVLFFSLSKVQPIMHGLYNGSIIKTSNKEYVSSDSLIYVAKSIDYTFFYNTELNRSEVLPNSEIVFFSIKKLSNNKMKAKKKMTPVIQQGQSEN